MRMQTWSRILLKRRGFVCAAGVVLVSCSPGRHAAIELDKVARSIDRYGFASISTPFVAGPSEEFEFDLNKTAKDYFEMAFKPQGGVRHFRAEALDVQAAFRVNIEQAFASLLEFQKVASLAEFKVAKAKAGLQKQLLDSLMTTNPALEANPVLRSLTGLLGVAANAEAPTDLPEFTPQTEGLPEKGPVFTPDQLSALKAVGASFSEGLKLPEDTFRISAREAILIASGDVATQALLKWFNRPHHNKLGEYELFMCPMVVSVQPGYQTRDQYLADITVNVDLAKRSTKCACFRKSGQPCERHLDFLSEEFYDSSPPILVTGVFPVIDAQVLNLVNSRRQLFSMALQLSMMGFGSQGDFFTNYAKKLERDAQTQTALTAASAYTIGDTAFGFRVEPKFVASKDPTAFQTEPGRILESRTFPALAAVLVDRRHLRRLEEGCCCPDGNTEGQFCDPKQCETERGDYEFLVFETSTRWSPMNERRRIFGGWLSLGGRVTEVDVWERALALDKVQEWLDDNTLKPIKKTIVGTLDNSRHFLFGRYLWFGNVHSRYQRMHLETRARNLAKLGLDSRAIVRVFDTSAAKRICVERVIPEHGWWDQYTVLTIRGRGFRNNVKAVTVGGIICDFSVPTDRTLLVGVPPWKLIKDKPPETFGELASKTSNLPLSAGAGLKGDNAAGLVASIDLRKESRTGGDVKGDSVKPCIRLAPEEETALKGMAKLVGECKLDKDSPKWEYYKDLTDKKLKQQVCEDTKKQTRDVKNQEDLKRVAEGAALAEIAIASRVPVCYGRACDSGEETFPADPINPTQRGIGWILFDKRLPKKKSGTSGSSLAKGDISITRDGEGRITGFKVGSSYESQVKAIIEAIAKGECCDGDSLNLEIDASGSARIKAGAKTDR